MENATILDAPPAAAGGPGVVVQIKAFQANLEANTSFVMAHAGGVFDFRPMAQEIRRYLASDRATGEDFRYEVDMIRHDWLTKYFEKGSFSGPDLKALLVFSKQFESEFRGCMDFHVEDGAAAPSAPAGPKTLSGRISERLGKIFSVGEALHDDIREIVAGTSHMTAEQREDKLHSDMSDLCQRFGLAGFHIAGDTALPLRERERLVARSTNLMEAACGHLGIEEASYGDEGKVQFYCGTKFDGNSRGLMHPSLPFDGPNMLPKIGLSLKADTGTAVHEWTHYLDFKKARLATGDDPELLRESRYFSGLSDHIQDRLPEAKKALHEVMGVHQEARGTTTDQALKQFRHHIVKETMGKIGFMSASMEQMTKISKLLSAHDDLFTKTVVEWCTRQAGSGHPASAPISDSQRLYAVVALSCADSVDSTGTSVKVNLTAKLAEILKIDQAECEKKLMGVLANSTGQIQKVAGYVNPMARYVDRPDAMLRAGGETLVDYPNQFTEVLARTVGRASTLRNLFAAMDRPAWFDQPLGEKKRATLNRATKTMIEAAGMKANQKGPRLGVAHEKAIRMTADGLIMLGNIVLGGYNVINTALDNALYKAESIAAKGKKQVGARLMQTLSAKPKNDPNIHARFKAP